jgi:hypothetical protein
MGHVLLGYWLAGGWLAGGRREAFRAVWREGQWGSDADAAKAEKRFKMRLSRYRAGLVAPPAEWQVPGTRLAEALEL